MTITERIQNWQEEREKLQKSITVINKWTTDLNADKKTNSELFKDKLKEGMDKVKKSTKNIDSNH